MNTANFKIDLINKITQIKETNVIKEIKRVLDFELDEGIFQLTNDQKKRIVDAKQEVKQKKYLTDSSANKEISEWLDK
jgi:vacuolar-type H+-ATPase subunit H